MASASATSAASQTRLKRIATSRTAAEKPAPKRWPRGSIHWFGAWEAGESVGSDEMSVDTGHLEKASQDNTGKRWSEEPVCLGPATVRRPRAPGRASDE